MRKIGNYYLKRKNHLPLKYTKPLPQPNVKSHRLFPIIHTITIYFSSLIYFLFPLTEISHNFFVAWLKLVPSAALVRWSTTDAESSLFPPTTGTEWTFGGEGREGLGQRVSKNFDRHSSLARPCILNGRTLKSPLSYLGDESRYRRETSSRCIRLSRFYIFRWIIYAGYTNG